MPITVGVKALVDAAEKEIKTLSLDEANALLANDATVFVDIRDIRELHREGKIAGAIHAPRGMLEFWFDPESPYFKEALGDENKTYVFYCAAAWRSALSVKTLQDMGMTYAVQFADGFKAWKEAGGPVGERPAKDA